MEIRRLWLFYELGGLVIGENRFVDLFLVIEGDLGVEIGVLIVFD